MFRPRPKQAEVLSYRQGKMGVAAVPGSGKTFTLSRLAADLIAAGGLNETQEVLIVTLVNSAVDNFSSRIGEFIKERKLLPNMGYRVRTLHGLAHDIVKERPDLVGLPDRFLIIDEQETDRIIQRIVQSWMHLHPEFLVSYSGAELDLQSNHRLRQSWFDYLRNLAVNFIRTAKDLQLHPRVLAEKLKSVSFDLPLIQMGLEIYTEYQRALNFRGAVDFDDLIRYALQALNSDRDFLFRLQNRWPFILEDEAQDSSRLQEEILRLLAGLGGNWVRVGDTNQAIYETFTTANPKYLRAFLMEEGVRNCDLPNSGRSTQTIINFANSLIDWVQKEHPLDKLRSALTLPYIRATPANDPQPNPKDNPLGIYIQEQECKPEDESHRVVNNIQKWLPQHMDQTVAILVPRNDRGAEMVGFLKEKGIPYIEMLRSTSATRKTAALLTSILRFLSDPASTTKLASIFKQLYEFEIVDQENLSQISIGAAYLKKIRFIENFLYPFPGNDHQTTNGPIPDGLVEIFGKFTTLIKNWSGATLLPIDQLVITIAQGIFTNALDLALAHKLALLLETAATSNPSWDLPEFALELEKIASNERKFLGFSDLDQGFNPDDYKGKVIVSTIHKAKGLEWDRVYLCSVNNYDFPSCQPGDLIIGEKWFVREKLNLEAEMLQQLNAIHSGDDSSLMLEEGHATYLSRLEYASERLRLLFVGITRARKELIITWNNGRRNECRMALPLQALLEKRNLHSVTS